MFDPAPQELIDPSAAGHLTVLPPPSMGKVLVVDDELTIVRVYARALGAEGYHVFSATDGESAEVMFRECKPDAVVSDISMHGMDGISLLRAIRRIDRDVPVILATGDHQDERAHQAVAAGALMYFVKPVDLRALAQSVGHATQLHRLAKITSDPREHRMAPGDLICDREELMRRFDAALETLWIMYQPIVHWATLSVVGCTARASSDDPALDEPCSLFAAAHRLGRTLELGRTIRARIAAAIPCFPPKTRIFVNLHADELQDDELYALSQPLLPYASRVVLEVTERDTLDHVTHLASRIDKLRASGFRIAVDDLGVGYAGLASFALLKPSVVKLDMSLVRDIDKNPIKRKVVQAMTLLCREMGVEIIAEGVETEEERQTLGFLGCRHHQGFAYVPPQRAIPRLSV